MLTRESLEPRSTECSRCLYTDVVYAGLTFDSDGVCSACRHYDEAIQVRVRKGAEGSRLLSERLRSIKSQAGSSDFDCVIGVSGGTDSTYVAYLAKTMGLRPLAVHVDNGWNSELAVHNIHHTLKLLEIPLETYVIDWREFKALQLSFLYASTPDGEVPTDHAIQAALWRTAARNGIRTIISGMNFTTESTAGPATDWAYGHQDWYYIRSVHQRFSNSSLSTFPHYRLDYLLYVNAVRRIRTLSILNYVEYNKSDVRNLLETELGWRDYGGKHHESIYTRFYQGYVLPRKFGIDKRYWHLSDLVRAGQLERSEAALELSQPPYSEDLMADDLRYVTKKLHLSGEDFDKIMALPVRSYRDYPNRSRQIAHLKRAVHRLRSAGLYDL